MRLVFGLLVLWAKLCLAGGFASELDIQYGSLSAQKLDIFQPDRPSEGVRPAVIFIHGGGWSSGDKTALRSLAQGVTKYGYVGIPVNYRLVVNERNRWPTQLDDVQRVVRWLRQNASKYGIDEKRIGAFGTSAGAHLAACLGTMETRDNSDPELAGHSSRVACVVDLFGPTDLTDIQAAKGRTAESALVVIRQLLGGNPSELADAARSASPLLSVDAQSSPFLIFHGGVDDVVPISQSARLNAALQKAGVESNLIIFPEEGHGFSNPENNDRYIRKTLLFLRRHLPL